MPAIQKVQNATSFNKNLVKVFSACNATPGTGVAQAVTTAFAATVALVSIRNNGSSGLLRPRYIRLINTVVPASGTRSEALIALDTGVTRVTGGTTLTAKNRDMGSSVTSSAIVKFGAVTANAATAAVRVVSRFQLSTVIAVAFEEWMVKFGDHSANMQSAGSYGGTTATGRQIVADAGPVLLGPGQEMFLHVWHPSNAATPPSWETEVCWEETRK